MHIGLLSDLHLEFGAAGAVIPEKIDADVVVIAGDLHPSEDVRKAAIEDMEQRWNIPVLFCAGNHDYYRSTFPTSPGRIVNVHGVRFALSALWTQLSPLDALYTKNINDFTCIKDITLGKWNEMNRLSVEFLQDTDADIIVTHHGPSYQSISPRWRGNPLNAYFANNLDLRMFPATKLWLHGHVHDRFDYTQDGIRVVTHPWGYPGEFPGRPYDIKIIEL